MNDSGFKTKAITRPDVYIPTGMLDILVILRRGNLVKAFSIVTVIAICEYSTPSLFVTNAKRFFRAHNSNPSPRDAYLRIL